MNDLIPTEIRRALPSMCEGLIRALQLLEQVKSFADVERLFLRGAGLSPNTYRAYLQSVKDFYAFTEGLNPLQVLPADIERWFDAMVARRVAPATVNLRLAGLKRFFSGIRNVVPAYTSPFEIMAEKLTSKLRAKDKNDRTKKALNQVEIRRLLTWLRAEASAKDHAAILFLLTSGLRANELLSLRWGDLEQSESGWTATFTGKGGRKAEQELYAGAVEAARGYFKASFQRDPGAEDFLFWTEDGEARPLSYHTLWHRIGRIGKQAQKLGIIRGSLQFTPHLFRRSYITALYRSGMRLKALQKKSRHRSLDVLIAHYIDDSEAAAPYLAKILEGVA